MALWSNTDVAGSKPKYLNETEKAATLGLDVLEAQTAGNTAKGLNTPGWVKYSTYTDANGNTRHKSEVLVAMATMTGDNDTVDPDPVITIGTQPANTTVAAAIDAVFSVVASITNNGALTYQWQDSTDVGVTWADIATATSSTLTLASFPDEYITGDQFRVIVSGGAGATPVTSTAATLTVA